MLENSQIQNNSATIPIICIYMSNYIKVCFKHWLSLIPHKMASVELAQQCPSLLCNAECTHCLHAVALWAARDIPIMGHMLGFQLYSKLASSPLICSLEAFKTNLHT